VLRFFLGGLIPPGGFGFSRWAGVCVDIIGLPALLPFIVYALFSLLRIFSGAVDLANFAILWLIPGALIRALSWSAQREPSLLVLVPLLWTAIAVGIPFFLNLARDQAGLLVIPPVLGILALPPAAAASYWAFYGQNLILGFGLLFLSLIPLGIETTRSFSMVLKRE
jgi:hypothetical protein